MLCILTSEHNKKYLKMMKKVFFSSCAREAHVTCMKKNEVKSWLVSNWE